MSQIISAEFLGQPLNIIDHNGQKWLTAEQAGLALGYSKNNARAGVNNLYNRHADEFSEQDSIVIKLMTNSRGNPETRVFSATGCKLLGFFSNTARAKQFRQWAKAVLSNDQQPTETLEIPAYVRQELLAARPEWERIRTYYDMGLTQREMCKLLDLGESSLRRHLKRMAACQLVDYRPSRFHQQIGKLGREAQQINLALQEGGAA
jgi:prophage antirepressor-like protein